MHWILWYHCSKDTSVFLDVVSSLKVLMQEVPILSPTICMLRRWLIPTVSWDGITGHCGRSPYPHPLYHLVQYPCCWVHLHHFPQGPLNFLEMTPMGCDLSLGHFRASNASHNWSFSRSQTSLVSSLQVADIFTPDNPSFDTGTLERGHIPTPIPQIFVCAPDKWLPLTVLYSLICLPFRGRTHRIWWVCPTRLWLHWDSMLHPAYHIHT